MSNNELVPLCIVSDMEASRKFYCDGLGFEMTQSWEPDDVLRWCRIERDGAAFMLQLAGEDDPPAELRGKGVEFFIICEDASAIRAEITARGGEASEVKQAFYGMAQVFVVDPDGYRLCFENPT